MRSIASLLAIALAIAPTVGAAHDGYDAPRRRDRRARLVAQAPAPATYDARPAPAPVYVSGRAAPAPAPATYVTSRPGVAVVASVPFWWGLSLGWGYRPLYPRYEPAPGEDGYPASSDAADPESVVTRLSVAGAAMAGAHEGALGGLALAVDGRDLGVHVGVDAIAIDGVTAAPGAVQGDHVGWGSAHVTWSFLAQDAFRVRFELGASMLSLPSGGAFAGTTYAGKVAFGPDVGVSGQLGLVGPLGIEAHARLTPYPVPVLDTRVAAAVRGGPLALTAGWRTVRIDGDGITAPQARFEGPEVGLALAF